VLRASGASALIVVVLAIAATATASSSLRATFTKAIPASKAAGAHVAITWKLRDSAGHAVNLRRMFVKIVCPTGDASTIAYAKADGPGLYRANAIVPPGGIGTVTLGAKGSRIQITNPFHR
jgi:hypothetical protein